MTGDERPFGIAGIILKRILTFRENMSTLKLSIIRERSEGLLDRRTSADRREFVNCF